VLPPDFTEAAADGAGLPAAEAAADGDALADGAPAADVPFPAAVWLADDCVDAEVVAP
jgi:hypothetical protein